MNLHEESSGLVESVQSFVERNVGQRVHKSVSELLETGGFEDRFNYFTPYAPVGGRRSILISGSAVGTELLVARRYGFDYACGTEVQHELAALAPRRLQGIDGCDTILYDGACLPFPDCSFDVVASGHIIEHTINPASYLYEHLRVLRPGGVFFLEFPDRNHSIELHTTAPGFEWMPGSLREFTYTYLQLYCSQVSREHADAYDLIHRTLRPIGIRDVLTLVQESPYPAVVHHYYKPLSGFVRSIIMRTAEDVNAGLVAKRPIISQSFFDSLEGPLVFPMSDSRANQVRLLMEPGRVAELGERLARTLVFLLWCIGHFFALDNQIHEDLLYQIAPVFPGFRSRWRSDLKTIEDDFIPGLFSALLDTLPELDGPYWQSIVVAAFQNQCLRRALARYYECWAKSEQRNSWNDSQFSSWAVRIFGPL